MSAVEHRKARKEELLRLLQASKGQPECINFMALLNILLDEAKASLVTVEESKFLIKQGEARAYDALIRMLERPSPATLTEG